jgi:hypothetical protein
MKQLKNYLKIIMPVLLLQLTVALSFGQTNYTANTVSLIVNGTSTLHDWDMKSSKASCRAIFTFGTTGQINGLTGLFFSTAVSDLKSDHTSMDNNAYKALKTKNAPSITYVLSSATVTPKDAVISIIRCTGKLTIAGQSSDEVVDAVCKLNPDKSITVTGTKKLSMKNYSVDPPSFMFGAVKTGNDITLDFNAVFK